MLDAEGSPDKEEEEEEDDTMQNTVVLFSNTDKFVLMQVRCYDIKLVCYLSRCILERLSFSFLSMFLF